MPTINGLPVATKIRKRDLPFITGPKIKQLRKERGLTQEQFAELLGVGRSTVGNWEACLRTPTLEQYCTISLKLDIDISTLL